MVGRNFLEHEMAAEYHTLAPSSKQLNLLDRAAVEAYLRVEKPDCIIHAAGTVGGIQANIANPVAFLADNLQMGLNLALAASETGVRYVLNIASSCMYPRNARNPLNEDMVLKGELEPTNEGYALAKIVTSKLCGYISKEQPSKIYKTVIPCNLYGRYDKYDPKHSHLLPAVIKKVYEAKLSKNPIVSIWGDGTARREFMYAQDFADFLFFAIKNIDNMPDALNVGLGHDYTITEYYQAVAKVVGYKGDFEFDYSKPVGMKQKLIDVTKMKNFGWEHKTSLDDGIAHAFEFYKESLKNGI